MELININRVKKELKDYSFGQQIYYLKSVSSTNDFGKKLLELGKYKPAVIISEKQTRGKGRMGRSWSSRFGKGIWMSVIFPFIEQKKNPFVINYISSLAVQITLKKELGLQPEIKWPNDILLLDKKVCGILSETVKLDNNINHIVSGIGLNVNQRASDFPSDFRKNAISLKIATGKELDRTELIISIIRNINNFYLQERNLGCEYLFSQWLKECSTIGKEVELSVKNGKIKGKAISIDIDGTLNIKTYDHQIIKVITGDLNYIIV
ncbi:biotin--[acetyl-CoA-carboxylase] ligase [candidate division KSB1 bacterium]|nr:MAG: biotin--[acetyl-CoA-carboxylase] ligase [candidate division KSB1 bacterium]